MKFLLNLKKIRKKYASIHTCERRKNREDVKKNSESEFKVYGGFLYQFNMNQKYCDEIFNSVYPVGSPTGLL